jgi:hypothetical protein
MDASGSNPGETKLGALSLDCCSIKTITENVRHSVFVDRRIARIQRRAKDSAVIKEAMPDTFFRTEYESAKREAYLRLETDNARHRLEKLSKI